MSSEGNSFIKGTVNMLIASAFFAVMGATVKILGQEYNSIQIVFWRNIFGTAFILSSLLSQPLRNKGGHTWLLIFRGVIGTLALYALFYNLSTIGMGLAITFLQTSPIFVAIFSHFFLKERLGPLAWLAIIIGFVGIMVIFRPTASFDWSSGILGLICGVFAGAGYTALRGLRNYYASRTVVLSFTVSGILLPMISMLFGEVFHPAGYEFMITQFKWPESLQWLWLILVALTAIGGQVFITRAYANEKAGIMSAVGYMTIPFSIIIGTSLGDPLPDVWEISGIVLIIMSGVIISIRRNG